MNLNNDSVKPMNNSPDQHLLKKPQSEALQYLDTPVREEISRSSHNGSFVFPSGQPAGIVPSSSNRNSIYNSNRHASVFTQPISERQRKSRCYGCKITRGIFLAIVFFVFFLLILGWFFFSSDLIDEEFDSIYGSNLNSTDNRLNPLVNPDFSDSTLFAIIVTGFIVFCIVFLVFAGSLCQYFRNPELYQDEGYARPTTKSAVESIFSSRRTLRNDLYYLDLNMKAAQMAIQPNSSCHNEQLKSKGSKKSKYVVSKIEKGQSSSMNIKEDERAAIQK